MNYVTVTTVLHIFFCPRIAVSHGDESPPGMDKARMKKIYIEKRPSRGLHMWYTTAQTDKTDAHIETTIESADKYCELSVKLIKKTF